MYKRWLLGLWIGSFPLIMMGQDSLQVEVQIKIIELGYYGKKKDVVFKFFLDSIGGKGLNANGNCFYFSKKDDAKRFYAPKDTALSGKSAFLQPFFKNPNVGSLCRIWMVAYDKSKGDPCTFSNKDSDYGESFIQLNLNDYVPGGYSDTLNLVDSTGNYFASMLVKQSLPAPSKINASEKDRILPAHEPVTFESLFPLNNKRGLNFQWEYALEEGGAWRPILTRPKDTFSITVNPLEHFFDDRLRQTQKVMIRLKASSKDTLSFSEPFYAMFTPKPPSIEKYDIKVGKTCASTPTGSIAITNIKTDLNQIAYLIVKSNNSPSAPICNLQNPTANNCPGLVKQEVINNRMIDVKRLGPGNYHLILYNAKMEVDKVFTSIPFEVETYGALVLDDFEVRNPDCENPSPGKVSFTMKGGDWERANVVLDPVSGIPERKLNEVSFNQLAGNYYALTVTDGCGSVVKEKFQILGEAPRLIVESIKPLKSKGATGVDYQVTLKNGIGPFKVTFKDTKGRLVSETKLSSEFTINLPPGKIDLNILDEKDPKCMKVDMQIDVAPQKK
jgi:hypothetical protein